MGAWGLPPPKILGPRPDFRFLNNALQPKYHQAGSVNPHKGQVP